MPEIIWIDEVGSTNDLAKELLRTNPEPGTIVSTHKQTNGRGQYGRVWLFEEGALAFSVILKFQNTVPENLTVRIGECVAAAVTEQLGYAPEGMHIKLPNDILVGDKKICGILTEAQTIGKTIWVVCGIGLNANCAKVPEPLREIATSLYLETGQELDTKELMLQIQRRLTELCSLQ